MELLAPCGTIDAFHAAIDAGANAVYLGLDAFNARLRAQNFTVRTLAHLIPYAHSRKVRVYITLNTLIKQSELRALADTLHQVTQLQADGAIVADPGLIRIARRHFPSLPLHGSTQMFLHNRLAIELAARLGLARVILPRELTLEEIAALGQAAARQRPRVQLEIFGHGALCYSFSGQCLASSYIGGGSGNRGRCAQVCRRSFCADGGSGHYFSPRDLQTIEMLPRLLGMGIASLKIEGRMRSPEYVHTVIRAYRRAIDDPASIPGILDELRFDMGRPKTSLFLGGLAQGGIIESKGGAGTGVALGAITEVTDSTVAVATSVDVKAGDQVRIHPGSGFDGQSAKVSAARRAHGSLILSVADPSRFSAGDEVYLVSRKAVRSIVEAAHRVKVTPLRVTTTSSHADRIAAEGAGRPLGRSRQDRLHLKIDTPDWLPLIGDVACDTVMAALGVDDLVRVLADQPLMSRWAGRLMPCLPTFIPESQVKQWSRAINEAHAAPLAGWMCGHASQISLLPRRARAIADCTVPALNLPSQALLRDLGYAGFCYPLEDDFPNMRAQAASDGHAYVYARVPLFTSRIRPDVGDGRALTDPRNARFLTARRQGLYYLLGDEPFCLFHRLDKLREAGIRRFVIDLSFMAPDKALLSELLGRYNRGEKVEGSTLFNFKRGLR